MTVSTFWQDRWEPRDEWQRVFDEMKPVAAPQSVWDFPYMQACRDCPPFRGETDGVYCDRCPGKPAPIRLRSVTGQDYVAEERDGERFWVPVKGDVTP